MRSKEELQLEKKEAERWSLGTFRLEAPYQEEKQGVVLMVFSTLNSFIKLGQAHILYMYRYIMECIHSIMDFSCF